MFRGGPVALYGALKNMNTEKYEKHIAEIEQDLDMLREENARLKDQARVADLKAIRERGKYLQGLSGFLTKLYGELGKIQHDVMRNLNHINTITLEDQESRTGTILKELKQITSEKYEED